MKTQIHENGIIKFEPGQTVNPRKGVPVDYTRNPITTFSRPSQNRLKEKLITMEPMEHFLHLQILDSAFYGKRSFQERNSYATRCNSKLMRFLENKGFAGIGKREFKIRKSGIYKGQVLPHFHLITDCNLTDDELTEINDFWIGIQSQGKGRAIKSEYLCSGTPIQDRAKVIEYMVKPHDSRAMEQINGATIGRSWWAYGNVEYQTPKVEDHSNNPKGFFQAKRIVRRYITAQKKRYGVRSKQISKALMYRIKSAYKNCQVFINGTDAQRILNLCTA